MPAGQDMLTLDHLTVIAPTLVEGVAHVRSCLDLDVPFGQRHAYMGTHNHLLQLGGTVYLEIVALDPDAQVPGRARWFGLDDRIAVKADWDAGRRLRGWVARTSAIDLVLRGREDIFGRKVSLPWSAPSFDFAIPDDGALPLGGAAPSIIDRRGKPRAMAAIADLGARLRSFTLAHRDAAALSTLYETLGIDRPPVIIPGDDLRYRALIETPAGAKELS
ncbi:VOC family protein [Bosea sp. 2RAB26]|uniref:VOC family protein n=1 Tax=Bosea sp. 2RAB26 TaxID=3237476 RepID=UPI003F8ED377